uniref:adenylate kinase n=1 Tax=Polytomella parva TaxID=51329 RepID=A0A7S0VMY3_9CHLO|nr:adenylate kinase (ADK) [Polytomella parva]|eukprot:CAMPEP_0175040914 /NCGR_PEP_ID=MMETSP0052_2-20121109/1575_1 /TAXON_ID=51329 ORGANISM="Polytomella parva, Strain SAG 63-3" /NCGR_SAMPLE_ID=MMETSP0052_2 /ASSEMBLY_ACC=CAM_ASM_000194 /LENGTH=259 /DNA_ID=CAMNT_0016303273 /DNA_START=1 /DNA_END=780 /DNA_ORIENTATION=-
MLARSQILTRALAFQNAMRYGLTRQQSTATGSKDINWVFLGPPGVGKGTYASRVAKALGVPHIATGDLIRDEIKSESSLGKEMKEIVSQGKLLPDDVVLKVLQHRLENGKKAGEKGYILDGFPRTRAQSEALLQFTPVNLAVNLGLREEVLVEKCMGRRVCTHCGKNYNIANIHLAASNDRPEIVMPPLNPPPECAPHLEIRADDTELVIRRRLKIYSDEAQPVEDFFREKGLLLDFEITGGIPETLPVLTNALKPFTA